ncbi:MAG: Rne/Rng family ribonuclease [Bacteroidales bacterium]|nr:Rne/Rng family ribonuclease [Bacteroidales bacterium]
MEESNTTNRELVICKNESEVNIALLENKQLAEYRREILDSNFAVGDIFYGRVKKVLPGLNAAFVDVGDKKNAFIHYLDLGPQIKSLIKFTKLASEGKKAQVNLKSFELEPDIEKNGKISDIIQSGDLIPVQIVKEPIATKGPRISADISFPGRFIVLIPFSNKISVSNKIKSKEERSRLRKLIQSIKPQNFGIIIRTVAEGKNVEELDADMKSLVEKWNSIAAAIENTKAPAKVASEMSRVSVILRDLLNDSFNGITVNTRDLYEDVRRYIEKIDPQQSSIVKYYKEEAPIFDYFGITKQIKGLFGRIVTIRNGVYLIIEHTEAMHVIDVNSGHRVNKDNTQEENALEVNLEAAAEIARQLRLRDMGGIIIVDFIDLHKAENRKALFDKLQEEMSRDRAKHTILPATKFGLIQITRERVRPETEVIVMEKCPTCDGKGNVRPWTVFIDELESNVKYLLEDQNEGKITLQLHPFVAAYLTKGFFSIIRRWNRHCHGKVKIQAINSFNILQFNFLNKKGDNIII